MRTEHNMGSKLLSAGCFLGATLGILSLFSAATSDTRRILRLSIAGLALVLIVAGSIMMFWERRQSRD